MSTRKPIATKRAWKPLRVPPSWITPGARVAYHFIMSYHDSEAATVVDKPYQLASGDWCVMIVRDSDGRRIPAAIEALDQLPPEPPPVPFVWSGKTTTND